MQEKAERFRTVIKMTGLSFKKFSERSAISLPTLNAWLYGLNKDLTANAARRILDAAMNFNVYTTVEWLLEGKGRPPRVGRNIYQSPESTEVDPVKGMDHEMSIFNSYGDTFTHLLRDDAMQPLYLKGDYVGGKFYTNDDLDKAIGKDCIVKLADSRLICRRLHQGETDNTYNLYLINPLSNAKLPVLINVSIMAAAPVIRLWRTPN